MCVNDVYPNKHSSKNTLFISPTDKILSTIFAPHEERCMQQSCVSCPQADVICTRWCVICGKALLIYYLTIYNVQLMYYLVILCCRPLSDTRRVVSVNSRGRGFLAGKAARTRRISAEN